MIAGLAFQGDYQYDLYNVYILAQTKDTFLQCTLYLSVYFYTLTTEFHLVIHKISTPLYCNHIISSPFKTPHCAISILSHREKFCYNFSLSEKLAILYEIILQKCKTWNTYYSQMNERNLARLNGPLLKLDSLCVPQFVIILPLLRLQSSRIWTWINYSPMRHLAKGFSKSIRKDWMVWNLAPPIFG